MHYIVLEIVDWFLDFDLLDLLVGFWLIFLLFVEGEWVGFVDVFDVFAFNVFLIDVTRDVLAGGAPFRLSALGCEYFS